MRNITISKGLDIPISGEVTDSEITKHVTKKVAVLGKDHHDLKPTMLVKVGDQVKKGQNFAEWDDPFPKPTYLFAIVAGDLSFHQDEFITMNKKSVSLRIYHKDKDLSLIHI